MIKLKNVAIIGGEISGLTIAYFLDKFANNKQKKVNIDIIERKFDFAQSKIDNFQYNQEVYDCGLYNSIKDNSILLQLILELGLYKYLIESKYTNKLFYDKEGLKIFPKKILYGYPLDKFELVFSDIFNFKDKLSILCKLHKNNKLYDISKITVEDFFLSKVNERVYLKLIEPLLTSHYGSNVSKKSFSLTLPELSFATIKNNKINNIVKEMYLNKKEDNIIFGKEYRLKFTLKSFIEALESNLSNKVFTSFNSEVSYIKKSGDGYYITYDNKTHYYDYLIITNKHINFLPWFENDKRLKRYYNDLTFTSNLVITILVKKESIVINNEVGEIIFSNELNSYISKIEYVSNKWIDIKSQNIHLLRIYINKQEKVKELIYKEDNDIKEIIKDEIIKLHKDIIIEKWYIKKIKDNYINANIKYSKYINEIDKYLFENYDKIYFIGNSKKAINLENTITESREVAKYIIEKL